MSSGTIFGDVTTLAAGASKMLLAGNTARDFTKGPFFLG